MPTHPETIGPYRILEPLGKGGMGVVYRSVHRETGEAAAVKTVLLANPGLLTSIRREIYGLSRMEHPGIVRILDEGLFQGLPWYAMALVEGAPLGAFWAFYRSSRASGRSGAEPHPSEASNSGSASGAPALGATATELVGQTLSTPVEPGLATEAQELQETAEAGTPTNGEEATATGFADTAFQVSDSPLKKLPDWDATRKRGKPGYPRQSPFQTAADGHLEQAVRLIRDLCEPLAYLHGEGFIHGDLKPQNVLVTPEGQPVLVDFGLLNRFGGQLSRESLRLVGESAGSPGYMAPEQIRGELLDARADLYALGCIFYKLVTGRAPFESPRVESLLRLHLVEEPLAASALVGGVPEELDRLILRLLRKEPRQRLGYAVDLALELDALLGSEILPKRIPQRLKPKTYLYRPDFGGRKDELQALKGVFREFQKGLGGLALIGGESGVGKTRLCMELSRLALQSRYPVLLGECLPESPPLGALRRLLQHVADVCLEGGRDKTASILGRRGKVLGIYEPALQSLPGLEDYPEPVELGPKDARNRLMSDLCDTLQALSQTKPILCILDDLQWADELTLELLDFLLQTGKLHELPVLWLSTYRSDEITMAIESFAAHGEVHHLSLQRLSPDAVGQMICDMLALEQVPEALARFVAKSSEGNPFFVAEYLRMAVEEGLLWRDGGGRWQILEEADEPMTVEDYARLPLPGSIQALIGKRLERLSPEARRLAQAASVLGREVDSSILATISMDLAPALDQAILELMRQQVLEPAAGQSLRFLHDKLREVAYACLDEQRSRELHRRAAEALEALGQPEPGLLGFHWERGGDDAKAQAQYLEGARKALAGYAYADAERLYREYLRLATEPEPEQLQARYELARQVLRPRGKIEEAQEMHLALLQDAQHAGDAKLIGETLLALGALHHDRGSLDEALLYYERARIQSEESGERQNLGWTFRGIANLTCDRGRFEEARQWYQKALEIDRELGNRLSEGNTLGNLASVLIDLGLHEEAHQTLQGAMAAQNESKDFLNRAIALGNLANLFAGQDDMARSQKFAEESLVLHREIGSRRFEGHVLSTLGQIHCQEGRVSQGLEQLQQALRLHQQVRDPYFENFTRLRLVQFLRMFSRDLQIAKETLKEAWLFLQKKPHPASEVMAHLEEGHLRLAQGTTAAPCLASARRLLQQMGYLEDSFYGKTTKMLQNAQLAWESGQERKLYRGQLLADLTAGQRSWLENNGLISV